MQSGAWLGSLFKKSYNMGKIKPQQVRTKKRKRKARVEDAEETVQPSVDHKAIMLAAMRAVG